MLASNRVLNAILDHMLDLLPDEPAESKRLDDIADTDAGAADAELPGSMIPGSGVQSKLRAAS
jgi:hypothetical protein